MQGENLDVTRAEAQKLLLSMDPTVVLAGRDETTLAELRQITEADSPAIRNLWQLIDQQDAEFQHKLQEQAKKPTKLKEQPELPEQFLILIECADEREGLQATAKMS